MEAAFQCLQREVRTRHHATCGNARVVARRVGVPDDILVEARLLPGDLISACRRFRSNWRPGPELAGGHRVALETQGWPGSPGGGVHLELVPNLHQARRAGGLNHRHVVLDRDRQSRGGHAHIAREVGGLRCYRMDTQAQRGRCDRPVAAAVRRAAAYHCRAIQQGHRRVRLGGANEDGRRHTGHVVGVRRAAVRGRRQVRRAGRGRCRAGRTQYIDCKIRRTRYVNLKLIQCDCARKRQDEIGTRDGVVSKIQRRHTICTTELNAL